MTCSVRSFAEEIQYLKLCLGDKQSELDAAKVTLVEERTATEELLSQNRSLQQEKQLMSAKNVRFSEEFQTKKDRIKQLWQANCE